MSDDSAVSTLMALVAACAAARRKLRATVDAFVVVVDLAPLTPALERCGGGGTATGLADGVSAPPSSLLDTLVASLLISLDSDIECQTKALCEPFATRNECTKVSDCVGEIPNAEIRSERRRW